MKNTKSNSRPLHSVLCTLLLAATALWALPKNGQADIVFVTPARTEAWANTKPVESPSKPTSSLHRKHSGLLESGGILYVPNVNTTTDQDVVATYNAKTGALINLNFLAYPVGANYVPAGMALSGSNLYVANYGENSIALVDITTGAGNPDFIPSGGANPLGNPYALAIKDNVLYVSNNYLNSNSDVYISTYDATTGAQLNGNFIQIATGGLYGLAVKNNHLFVSIYEGSPPRVAEYNANTGALINNTFVTTATVDQPWGIAVAGNILFVVS